MRCCRLSLHYERALGIAVLIVSLFLAVQKVCIEDIELEGIWGWILCAGVWLKLLDYFRSRGQRITKQNSTLLRNMGSYFMRSLDFIC